MTAELSHQFRIVARHEIFFVLLAGATGPVEAAVEQPIAVDQRKLEDLLAAKLSL